jgi:hypothetical protein
VEGSARQGVPNQRIFAGPAASAAQTPAPAEDKEEGDDERNGNKDNVDDLGFATKRTYSREGDRARELF